MKKNVSLCNPNAAEDTDSDAWWRSFCWHGTSTSSALGFLPFSRYTNAHIDTDRKVLVYMRSSDVILLSIKPRLHRIGMHNVRTAYLKCENTKKITLRLFTVCKYIFTTQYCCDIVYLQHGGGICCKQNDVTVTTCIQTGEAINQSTFNFTRHR